MFYIKTTVDNQQIEIPIYSDEIFTRCYNCGKEMQVDDEMLLEVMKEGDLSSTSISCCNADQKKLIRIK